MNAKKIKLLRRVARDLPKLTETVFKKERVHGSELPAGAIDGNGGPINKTEFYFHSQAVETPIDHYERLKTIYQATGDEGVKKYCGTVTRIAAERQRQGTPIPQERNVQQQVV